MGKLILLPNLLGEEGIELLPSAVAAHVAQLDGLICESERGGRRFLSRFETKMPAREMPVALFDEELDFLLEPVVAGQTWGVVSDAGLPCLADPGADLVARARVKGIEIVALPGPSSLVMALQLSGIHSQRFSFIGYLRRDRPVADLETGEAMLFIETPYRNGPTLERLVAELQPTTRLCVLWDLTLPTQGVISKTVAQWRKGELPDLHRRPAIFVVCATRRERTSRPGSPGPCRDRKGPRGRPGPARGRPRGGKPRSRRRGPS